MLVLALDTSTDAVVVGLVEIDGHLGTENPGTENPGTENPGTENPGTENPGTENPATVLAEQVRPGARQHSEQLMPALLDVCAHAGRRPVELDAVVCGVGPGPFTGLRVGIASAAAFADALDVPAYGVCSLDAVAAGPGGRDGPDAAQALLVVTDARRREVYWAAYQGGRRKDGPSVDTPAALASRVPDLGVQLIAGTMAEELAESFGLSVHPAGRPTAAGLVIAAARWLRSGAEPPPLEPMYLRRPDAVPPGARKRVTAG